jgi:hypothetical protein
MDQINVAEVWQGCRRKTWLDLLGRQAARPQGHKAKTALFSLFSPFSLAPPPVCSSQHSRHWTRLPLGAIQMANVTTRNQSS